MPHTRLPEPSETGLVDFGDHLIEYARFTAADSFGPTLVLLHEGLGSLAMWRDFPARLAAATDCGVIAYSRRGYGGSSPRSGPYAVDYMHREAREALPRLLQMWSVPAPVLIGHSDGASIALIYAAEAAEPPLGVAVLAPHVFVEPMCIASITEAREQFAASDMAARLGRYHDNPEHAFRGWNDIWLDPAFLDWNIEALVERIECPVLAIQGEDDAYGTMAQIDGIAARAGGPVTLLKLAACGHSPHRDQPDDTLKALQAFIQGLGQQGD